MINVRKLAYSYLLSTSISRLPITIDVLHNLCAAEGYIVTTYDEGADVISRFSLQEHTKRKAFVFFVPGQNEVIIMYDSLLSVSDKVFCLAHELGHAVLRHTGYGVRQAAFDDTVQEREADEFAYALLAPIRALQAIGVQSVGQIQEHTLLDDVRAVQVLERMQMSYHEPLSVRIYLRFARAKIHVIAALLLATIIITCGALITVNTYNTRVRVAPDSIVVVTETGEKYHLPDCQYVKGKTNTSTMTEKEAIEHGYEPCKKCIDD